MTLDANDHGFRSTSGGAIIQPRVAHPDSVTAQKMKEEYQKLKNLHITTDEWQLMEEYEFTPRMTRLPKGKVHASAVTPRPGASRRKFVGVTPPKNLPNQADYALLHKEVTEVKKALNDLFMDVKRHTDADAALSRERFQWNTDTSERLVQLEEHLGGLDVRIEEVEADLYG